jgi:predicted nucleotide-binding protein
MTSAEELLELAARLSAASREIEVEAIGKPLDAVEEVSKKLNASFSGSWLGYHSRVYYANLQPAPPGANFSQEWGLKDLPGSSLGSRGDWREFAPDVVKAHIFKSTGGETLDVAKEKARAARETFKSLRPEAISILENELALQDDKFLAKLRDDLADLEPLSSGEVLQRWHRGGDVFTRDTTALGQGAKAPPHMEVLAEVVSIRQSFAACEHAAELCTKAASHLERKARRKRADDRIGTNVFIGHGRSSEWRKLKDFIQDRLKLPYDEFNRVPVAGVTNIARLSEMLDAAAVAFVILTAEDEMADGAMQARMNVVHEAGLFQGRLGFTRAIVLLEEGCNQFTNIEGLGQIRFPKGNIAACFEEIRLVLEREGLLSTE